jgi:uncharacterized membrane protein
MLEHILSLALIQGWCPMCASMGLWMILFWVVVIAAIVAVVWMLTRRSRQ